MNTGSAPVRSAASSSLSASASGQRRIGRPEPPRRDSSGSACERLRGAAEVVDELAEGDGPDVVGADQPQAGEPLVRGKFCGRQRRRCEEKRLRHAWAPIFGSSPAMRRRMLARCFIRTITLISAATAANLLIPNRRRAIGAAIVATRAASEEYGSRRQRQPDRRRRRSAARQCRAARRYRWRRPCRL